MATATVKVFHPDKNFGFLTTEQGQDLYVHGDQVDGTGLKTGDVVEYDVVEEEGQDAAAAGVKLVKAAPEATPVGRTMTPPPSWDVLEERERQRRAARRRRR